MSFFAQPQTLSLNEAQQQAWLALQPRPETILQALGQVVARAQQARQASEAGHDVQAQTCLEDTLLQTLAAMHLLGISAESALPRAIRRLDSAGQAFYIFPDKVEIRSQGAVQGTWPLYGEDDYQAAMRLARELGCEIIHTDSQQLALFT